MLDQALLGAAQVHEHPSLSDLVMGAGLAHPEGGARSEASLSDLLEGIGLTAPEAAEAAEAIQPGYEVAGGGGQPGTGVGVAATGFTVTGQAALPQ